MSDFVFFLNQLAILACGILVFYRYRNTHVGIFGGIGFAALFLIPMLQRLLWDLGVEWYRARVFFDLLFLAAYCFILYALYIMPAIAMTAELPSLKPQNILKPPTLKEPGAAGYQQPGRADYVPGMPRILSKPFYLGSILGSSTVSIIFFVIAIVLVMDNDEEEAVVFWLIGFLIAAYGIVIFAMLVHTMWNTIQDGAPRTTPGKGVGYLFIPFYNFYWIFQSFLGWSEDFNRYINERNISATEMPEGFVRALCIFAVIQAIPYIGMLFSLFYMMLLSIFIDRVCDAVNAVIKYKLSAQVQTDMT